MTRSRTILMALAFVLAPLPLFGQGGPPQGSRGGMMSARLLLEQGSVEYLVTKAADLQIGDNEKQQLEAIGARWAETTKASRDSIRASMPQQGGQGDREAMMQRMQAIRPLMEQLREEDRKSLDAALKLLTAEQQTKAKALLDERAAAARPRRQGGGR